VTVANKHPRTRRVVLRPSELRDLGGTAIAVALTVDPDQVTIPAGGEEQVQLSAELAADLVQPGERYVGTVEVSGGDEATLDVTVEVAS
jgi:HSP20 family molecular chaperone IbpA